MKHPWMVILGAACMASLSAQSVAPKAAQDKGQPKVGQTLVDTRWYVSVVPDDAANMAGEKAFDDIFVFQKDKVVLTECLAQGFAASPYAVKENTENNGRLNVLIDQSNPKGAKTHWDVRVVNDSIRGSLMITKPDAKVAKFSFSGRRSTPLEGTTWTAKISRTMESAPQTVTLVFHKGKLELQGTPFVGFASCEYRMNPGEKGVLNLEARSVGKDGGSAVVAARILGTTIDGTVTFWNGDESVENQLAGTRSRDAAQPAGLKSGM